MLKVSSQSGSFLLSTAVRNRTVVASNNLYFKWTMFSSRSLTCIAKASIFFCSSSLQSEPRGNNSPRKHENLSAIGAVNGVRKTLDSSLPSAVPTVGFQREHLYPCGFSKVRSCKELFDNTVRRCHIISRSDLKN